MDKSRVAYLISDTYTQDELGIFQHTQTSRKVFVNVSSVTQTEWFNGGRNGLNPAYRFTMFEYDYQGESVIQYDGINYAIYRTYITDDDRIELYAELKKGNDNVSDD